MRVGVLCLLAGWSLLAAGSDAWPGRASPEAWTARMSTLRPETRARMIREADEALSRPPRPVVTLASAGSDDLSDPRVAATRAAFEDADDAVILAMAWQISGKAAYRAAAVRRLDAWATTCVPTGNPVDETRLDGLVHAWMLVKDTLAPAEEAVIRGWLEELRTQKRAWRFGPRTASNNHRTHQLKMLLLLDRALDDDVAFEADRAQAEAHAARNLDAQTGESVDLLERRALYYHAYDLDAWLEIELVTGCCTAPVTAAYRLLERRLRLGETGGEFVGSEVPLDAARSRSGYGYGSAGSTFDPERAEHAILAFYTGEPTRGDPFASGLLTQPVQRRNLYALARYESWAR